VRRTDGDRPGAARAVRAGLAILDQFQASLGATDIRASASAHAEDLARLGLELAVESGDPRSIFAATERGRAGALRFRSARPPEDAKLAADLAELRQVSTELRSGDGGDPGSLVARQKVLETAIRDRARHAAGSNTRADGPPGRAALRVALGRSVLIEYIELDGDLHALTMVAGRFTFHRLAPVAAAERALDALRAGLSWLALGVGSARASAAISEVVVRCARELDDVLLGPFRTSLGDSPLVIVPTGALHAMPWSALPSCASRAVSVAPSAALWHRAATDPSPGGGRIVLAHGPGLPYALAEVKELARLYGSAKTLTGARARVASVLTALEGAHVAHLAAHGHFRSDNPMFSELQFADGPLTVYDLERLAIPPRHVVLAACDSGLASVGSGDELIGLAAALLAMGSITLVASVIPVPDEASRALMLPYHRHLKAGHPAPEALQLARAETTESEETPAAAGIAAAGFVCFGAGRD